MDSFHSIAMLLTLMSPPQYIIEAVSVVKHWFQLVESRNQFCICSMDELVGDELVAPNCGGPFSLQE